MSWVSDCIGFHLFLYSNSIVDLCLSLHDKSSHSKYSGFEKTAPWGVNELSVIWTAESCFVDDVSASTEKKRQGGSKRLEVGTSPIARIRTLERTNDVLPTRDSIVRISSSLLWFRNRGSVKKTKNNTERDTRVEFNPDWYEEQTRDDNQEYIKW